MKRRAGAWALRGFVSVGIVVCALGCRPEQQPAPPLTEAVTLSAAKDLPVQTSLPDPMIFANGKRVQTPEQWRQRREEMKEIIQYYFTGTIPPPPGNVRGTLLDQRDLVNGTVKFERVRLSFGPDESLGFEVAIFRPADGGPFPTVVQPSFFLTPGSPMPTTAEMAALTTAPTTQTARPSFLRPITPESAASGYSDLLRRGYAVCTFWYQQCGVDNETHSKSTGFFSAYPSYDWGDLAAWAWGMSRCVDYLETRDFADKSKFIAVGHSRLGKTTLIAGAMDERFALVAPAGSGCAGTGAFRFNGPGRGGKQGIEDFAKRFGYQMGPRMQDFVGQVDRLPFDQHWLIALVAPRPLISIEALNDGACNGMACKKSWLAARSVYDFLGADDELGVNFREGKHALTAEDWKAILDFSDSRLLGKTVDRRFDQFPSDDLLH